MNWIAHKRTIGMFSALFIIAALMLIASPCWAIGEFVMNFKVPEINSLTVDDQGVIYAACNDGKIRVYTPEGKHVRDIAPISGVFRYPTSIFHYEGKLYLTDLWYSHVAVLDTDGRHLFHFGGPGTGPKRFSEPVGVFVWNGLIYVADKTGGTVQIFGPNGVYISRLTAQISTARGLLSRPVSVAVDGQGYVYVADVNEMRVKIYDARWKFFDNLRKPRISNFLNTFPGGLIVADSTSGKIGILNRERNIIGMVGYLGDAKDEFLGAGSAVMDSKGRLIASDAVKQDVKIFALPGIMAGDAEAKPDFTPGYATWAEDMDLSGDVLPAKAVSLPDGGMLVVDLGGKALIEIRGGRVDKAIRLPGWNPVSMALGPSGDIWVVDGAQKRVVRLSQDGEVISTISGDAPSAKPGEPQPASPERLVDPSDILVTASGEIMVADTGAGKVNVYNEDGKYLGRLGRGGTSAFITKPISMDTDEKGTIYVLDSAKPSIILYSDRGVYIREIGGYGAERELMENPVALRLVGDEIAIVDGGSNSLRIITKGGDLLMQFGSSGDAVGEFNAPLGVVDLGGGNLAVSDTGNSRISYFKYIYPH